MDQPFLAVSLDKKIKNHFRLQFYHRDIDTTCDIFETSNTHKITLFFIQKVKKYIMKTLDYFFDEISHGTLIKDLNIQLYLNIEKKSFPSYNIIDKYNCNNGYTEFYSSGKRMIIIYRYEDLFKTLIHEMIHYFEIDFGIYRDILLSNSYSRYFKIYDHNQKINLNEAYTETLACYLYIQFTYKNPDVYIQKYTIYLSQIANALLIHAQKMNKVVQTTHCISYYIITAYLFHFIEEFIYIVKNNRNANKFINLVEKSIEKINLFEYKPVLKMKKTIYK